MEEKKTYHGVLDIVPALKKFKQVDTLGDYFMTQTASLTEVHPTLETKLLKDTICGEIARLYGEEKGEQARRQLTEFPVVETGTHLSFIKDYDNAMGEELRTNLEHNRLSSPILLAHAGHGLHIGVHGSDASLKGGCSGAYFQLGKMLFPITSVRTLEDYVLYDANQIKKGFFSPAHKLTAKLDLLYTFFREEKKRKESEGTGTQEIDVWCKKLAYILGEGGLLDPEKVQKRYESSTSKGLIEQAFDEVSESVKKKMGITFSDIDAQYEALDSIFKNTENLPDAVAKSETHDTNILLEGTGVEHVAIDACEVGRKFMIAALKDKDSLWYRVFSNPELFATFQKQFAGVRSGWKEHEAPFKAVRKNKDKGFCKITSCLMEGFDPSPESVVQRLENKELIPSSAMMMLIFQSAGVLAHGGYFQSGFAQDIKDRFIPFLKAQKEDRMLQNVQKLEVSTLLLSLVCFTDDRGHPLKLSQLGQQTPEDRKKLLQTIPKMSAFKCVLRGLPSLYKYLKKKAPRLLEAVEGKGEQATSLGRWQGIVQTMPVVLQRQK